MKRKILRKIAQIEDYEQFVGPESIERILEKARKLDGLHVVNVNSTYYGGGVSELLSSMTLLMNGVGIKTGWRVIQGSPDSFTGLRLCRLIFLRSFSAYLIEISPLTGIGVKPGSPNHLDLSANAASKDEAIK